MAVVGLFLRIFCKIEENYKNLIIAGTPTVEVVRFFCYSVIVGLEVLLEESIVYGGDDYA